PCAARTRSVPATGSTCSRWWPPATRRGGGSWPMRILSPTRPGWRSRARRSTSRMPDTTLKIELDGDVVADEDVQQLLDVQVEESSVDADAATLVARVEPGADGEWASLLDPHVEQLLDVLVRHDV